MPVQKVHFEKSSEKAGRAEKADVKDSFLSEQEGAVKREQDLKLESPSATGQSAAIKKEKEQKSTVTKVTSSDAQQLDAHTERADDAFVHSSLAAVGITEDSDTEDPNDIQQGTRVVNEMTQSKPVIITNRIGSPASSLDPIARASPAREELTASDEQPDIVVVKDDPEESEARALRSLGNSKKQNRMVVEVEVDTYKNFLKKKEEDFEKIKKLKNSKILGKKAEKMEISLQSAWDRLKPIGLDPYPIIAEEAIKDTLVSRAFMSDVYGGSTQSAFATIGKKHLAEHGLDDFLYLNTQSQQMAPQFPGYPGLFITTEEGVNRKESYRVFLRHESFQWQFIGIYSLKPSTPLSKQEWLDLDLQVRKTWCERIYTMKWGRRFRARIIARRVYHRKPTKDEWSPFVETRYEEAGLDDIRKALDSGDQNLTVYTLKCIGYEENFHRQLCQKWAAWVPPTPRPPRKRKRGDNGQEDDKATKTKDKAKQGQVCKKNKRAKSVESESESSASAGVESEDEELSDGDDNQESARKKQKVASKKGLGKGKGNGFGVPRGLVYRPRGTKSRPIVL